MTSVIERPHYQMPVVLASQKYMADPFVLQIQKRTNTILIPEQGSGLANYTVKWTLFSVSPNSLYENTLVFLSSFKVVP